MTLANTNTVLRILFLSGVFSLNLGRVFEGRDPQMCTLGSRVPNVPKFHEKNPSSLPLLQRAKKTREDPQREKERANMGGAGEGKETRNSGFTPLFEPQLFGP